MCVRYLVYSQFSLAIWYLNTIWFYLWWIHLLVFKYWTQDWNRTNCCSSNLLLIYITKFQESTYSTTALYLAWAYFSTCWTWSGFGGGCVCVFGLGFFTDDFLSISLPSESLSAFYYTGAKKILLIWFQQWIRRAALHRQAKPDIQSLLAMFSCTSTF